MSKVSQLTGNRSFDYLLFNLDSVKDVPEVESYLEGDYKSVLRNETAQNLYAKLVRSVGRTRQRQDAELQEGPGLGKDEGLEGRKGNEGGEEALRVFVVGLAAFNAFLQANVTGPPLELGDVFQSGEKSAGVGAESEEFRERCLRSLDVDGVSVYQHIPSVELLCLARIVFTVYFPRLVGIDIRDSKWMRIRINAYHQRLLSGLSGGRMSDSSMLQDIIERDLKELEVEVLGADSVYGTEAKVQFVLEKAQIYIMQGLDIKARENVKLAKEVAGFEYALSGALGKRTKFQQNDISQLVVFAKSREDEADQTDKGDVERNAPKALDLNDDTVLEEISFAKSDTIENSALPAALKGLKPDEQPQLKPLDQITLLTEATLKDTLSPLDKLNSEEILPYAIRVLSDKPTNWQIYTQALLVRSRIEAHRSRTQERSVLQLQVIVDQIIANTQDEPIATADGTIPEIRVTQFLPRAKASESAPVIERLQYIFQLNTPTRWELETELAYAWSGAGSFISALEIFKRLKLWAEVALCYHSVGQEGKARQIVRRQLYFSKQGVEMDKYNVDAPELITENWEGDIRTPSPAHAPRLWCILGDLENDPSCWLRAWEISKHRYARAQRTLGEFYVKSGDLDKARECYMQATVVNRQNNDSWSRLGDIDLKVGNWDGAIVAFQQSIMIDETDAKTYSNLGSALLSKYHEVSVLQKAAAKDLLRVENREDENADVEIMTREEKKLNPKDILKQALMAYKRGAALAHSNWQIWENVITIAGRTIPPSFPDLLLGLRAVIRIRSPTIGEDAIDIEVLTLLVQEVITGERTENINPEEQPEKNGGVYIPPRGSLGRAVMGALGSEIVPLITTRAALWGLVEKMALWRRDYKSALECAERSWRLVTRGEEWLDSEEGWMKVVEETDRLVGAFENYGGMEVEGGKMVEKGWRGKARSAVKGVMGRARDVWEGSKGWEVLEGRLEELKS